MIAHVVLHDRKNKHDPTIIGVCHRPLASQGEPFHLGYLLFDRQILADLGYDIAATGARAWLTDLVLDLFHTDLDLHGPALYADYSIIVGPNSRTMYTDTAIMAENIHMHPATPPPSREGWKPVHGICKGVSATRVADETLDHAVIKGPVPDIGLCPFHDDTRPSMYLFPEQGTAFCPSCGTRHRYEAGLVSPPLTPEPPPDNRLEDLLAWAQERATSFDSNGNCDECGDPSCKPDNSYCLAMALTGKLIELGMEP